MVCHNQLTLTAVNQLDAMQQIKTSGLEVDQWKSLGDG
jgi:hypothetical protein